MPNKLNHLQKAAVDIKENALVLACPGSGKTRVLTLKIAKELDNLKSRHDRVAALTYTNRAADEIERRIDKIGIDSSNLWTGTIHSFCLQWILKPYAMYIDELKQGYSIIDEFNLSRLKEEIKEEFNLPQFANLNTRLNRKGDYINQDQSVNEVAKILHQRLIQNRMIDFDLILYYSFFLLERNSKISKHLSRIFSYFFIDEYQDTQDLQYAIVGKIISTSNGYCKIFLVGDPDQAIFKSLGGIAKGIFEISEDIGGYPIKHLELTGNYRSTQRVINFYKNFQNTKIEIQSYSDYANEDGIVALDMKVSKNKLAEEISKIIKINLDKGIPPNEICVIAPQWTFLTSLARKLKALLPDVPLDAPGLTILPRNPDNFWYRLSRLILCPVHVNKYTTRIKWAKGIFEDINHFNITVFDTDGNNCRKLLKFINGVKIDEIDGMQYLKIVFLDIFKYLNIDIETNKVLSKQWNSFFESLKARYESHDFKDIPKDISYMRNMFEVSKGIVINTCQGVKGEEFETVIAFGLLRGYLPHWNSIIDQPRNVEIEDSSKLLYVIGSRAKKNLYLISETGRVNNRGNPYETNYQLRAVQFEYDLIINLEESASKNN